MALAFLRYEESDGSACRFRFDLGSNRYYAYVIGDEETYLQNGVRVLENRKHVSPVLGPLPEEDDGRSDLEIPCRLFDHEHRTVQLFSFRTRDRKGPAASSILKVSPGDLLGEESLPEITFSQTTLPVKPTFAVQASRSAMARPRVRHCCARIHRRPPLARAQDLGIGTILGSLGQGLLGTLPSLLPQLIPVATNALGALSPQANAAFNNTQTRDALGTLLRAILSAAGVSQPAATPAAAPPAPATPATPATSGTPAQSTTTSLSLGPRYSQAMFDPVTIMAALPALAPLLQQVLQVADPTRLLGTLGQLGIVLNQQEMQHLERLNPGVNDPVLGALLQQMSVNMKEEAVKLRFRRVESVKLQFVDVSPVSLAGRQVTAYQLGRDWAFPLKVETPRQIPPGQLRIVIKNARTLKVVAEDRLKTPPIAAGLLPIVNRLPAERLNGIRAGEDYLVCAYLLWKNKKGERIGAHMTQPVTAVNQFSFDGVEEAGEVIPLNDVDKFRDFWHQAWTETFSRDLIRIELECLYYFLLMRDELDNAQLDTTARTEEKGLHRRQVRLESGLLLSPNRLNELLPKISSYPALDEKELAALLTPDFGKHLRLAARTSMKFAGRPGQSAALWVFPEVKVKQVLLQEAAESNANGLVLGLQPRVVHFPIPVLAHFVGVRST